MEVGWAQKKEKKKKNTGEQQHNRPEFVVRVCGMVCEKLKHIGTTYVSAYYFIRVRIPLEVQAERLEAAGVSWETADEFA